MELGGNNFLGILFFAVRWLISSESRYGFLTVLPIWICIMIKSALAVYAGDMLILMILMMLDKNKRRLLFGRIGISFCILCLFCMLYVGAVHSVSGVFNFCDLAPRHNLDKCLTSGLYKNYPDQELVKKIDEQCSYNGDSGWAATTPVMKLFGEDEKIVNQKVQELLSKNTFLNEVMNLMESVFK